MIIGSREMLWVLEALCSWCLGPVGWIGARSDMPLTAHLAWGREMIFLISESGGGPFIGWLVSTINGTQNR